MPASLGYPPERTSPLHNCPRGDGSIVRPFGRPALVVTSAALLGTLCHSRGDTRSGASVCSGFSLHGPPWQPVESRDVALVWDYRQADLPEHYLRVFASTTPSPFSSPPGVWKRFNWHDDFYITWDGCGTPWIYSIMRYLPCSLLSPLSSTRILR